MKGFSILKFEGAFSRVFVHWLNIAVMLVFYDAKCLDYRNK